MTLDSTSMGLVSSLICCVKCIVGIIGLSPSFALSSGFENVAKGGALVGSEYGKFRI